MKLTRLLAAALAVSATSCEDLPPVPNLPPTAQFVYSPVSPINAGSTGVGFSALGSRDNDGEIASYVWTFGDGTPVETTQGPNVTHVFPDTAAICTEITYTVLLVVRDDDGDVGTASEAVTVTELPLAASSACDGPLGRAPR
jgi:PKD repeat protein